LAFDHAVPPQMVTPVTPTQVETTWSKRFEFVKVTSAESHQPHAEITMLISSILKRAVAERATDVHIVCGMPVMFRLNGDMVPSDENVLTAQAAKKMCYSMLSESQIATFEQDLDMDFIRTYGRNRFRINLSRNSNSVGAVIRILDYEPMRLEDIKLPEVVTRMCLRDKGLMLVTGTTSQGKTTTLAGIVDYINRHRHKHIISIEDPIEYIHENKKSVLRQREIGKDTKTFETGLKAALRQDPDVIVIGEMRDYDSIKIALTAAETGVLVLSTLHTISVDKIIERLFSYVPSEQETQIRMMLSEALLCIVHQELLPTLKEGKRVACEILVNTLAVQNVLRRPETYYLKTYIVTGQKSHGMRTMKKSLDELFLEGEISQEVYDAVLINYQ
jgi:twitching motility protein PilT|tara:strand:- start:222 stop:1388 length:1167 start_codon:yes stop_codon:yes gene_type:complete